jgi:hypothetical protein
MWPRHPEPTFPTSFFSCAPIFYFNIKLPIMNGTSLLAASVKTVQAANKSVSLPTSLEDAAISDVLVEDVVDKVPRKHF